MDADGVNVFHITHDDTVVGIVTDHFIFDFLPAGNALFEQNLVDQAHLKAAGGDIPKLVHIVGNAAARTAQRIGGTYDQREGAFV